MSSAVKAVTKVFNIVAKPLQKLFGALMPKPPNPGATSSGNELKQIIRSSKEPARYVFGRAGTGALLAWAQEQPGEQDEGEWLHLVYVLTEGTIAGLDQIYVDQEPVAAAGDRIQYQLISGATAADAYLLANSPDWQASQIGRGLTWVRVSLKYDPDYFASGIPDLLFEYRARNDIYDPRTQTSGYSNNAALVILWYIRHRLNVPDDEILWDTFIDAANVCAESVITPAGTSEPRYTVSGGFKADERKDRVLADLEAACAGTLIRIGGKFGLQVGAYYGPYELTIDEDMVIGTVTGQTEVSRADAVNTMRGKFIDPGQRWTETDYPAVSVAEWIAEDGEEIEDTLDLRFVSSPYQSQRLANIALRRKRAGGTLELPLNFRGYACRPGRVVQVNLPTLSISGEFRVVDWDFSGENGCKVTLQQEEAAIYDDAVGQPYNPFGFIQLPTGGIGSPTGLQYVLQTVGEVIQGRLVWNPVDAALNYNVVIKRDGLAVQSAQVPSGVERCDVGGLAAGNYTAEVRARGRLGQSGPAAINFAINVPATPDRVITTIGNREVTLVPILPPGASLGGGHYRFYVTQSEAATQPQADYIGEGLSFTHTGLSAANTYYYYVQSVNAYGASPFLRVEVITTNNFDEELALINAELTRPGGVLEQYDTELAENSQAITDAQAAIDDLKAQVDQLDPEDQGARIDELQQIIEREEQMQAIRYLGLRAQSMNGAAQQDVDRIVEANERGAISQRVEEVSVSFDDEFASVRDEVTAVYDPATGAVARAVTTVTVNGKKAMIGMQVDGTTAEIVAVADTFAVLNPISGELVTAFVVTDGRVIMPEAFIDSLTITKLRAADGSLAFENGKLRADLIDVGNLTAGAIVSSVQVNGRPAFALRSNGTFELNSTTSSGRITQNGNGIYMYQGSMLVVEVGELI